MLLEKLIKKLPGAFVKGPLDRQVRGIAYDARRVSPDTLFVAIPERGNEDANLISSAIDRGATAVICELEHRIPNRATRIHVPDVHEALARAASSYYQDPASQLSMIGVAGDETATEIVFFLKTILEESGKKVGMISSVHHEVTDRILPGLRCGTTALEMQQTMAGMVRAGCEVCLVELNRDTTAHKQLHGVTFDAIYKAEIQDPNFPVHEEAPSSAVSSIEDNLKEWDNKKAAVINIAAVSGSRSARTWNPAVQLTHGSCITSLLQAGQVTLDQHGSRCVVQLPERCFDCRLPSPFPGSLYSALAATGIALDLKTPSPALGRALNHLKPVPGLMEPVGRHHPFSVYVDRGHTVVRLLDTLKSLRRVTSQRLLLLLGCPGNSNSETRMALGHTAAGLADLTLITNQNPGSESPIQIAADIAAGHALSDGGACEVILDRAVAIRRLLHAARPGDVVLITGKGHENFQELDNVIVPFDDRVQARNILEAMTQSPPAPSSVWNHVP